MKLRFLATALALAITTIAAHAQVGLYFNPVFTSVNISTPDSGPFAFLGQDNTSKMFGGVDFGSYYMFSHQSKYDVGVDLRDTVQHGDSALLNSFLVGGRIEAKPMDHGFKPFGQVSFGFGRTHSPVNTRHITKFEYNIFGGVDKPIAKHVDFRMIEIGYGSVTTISSNDFDGTANIPAAKLITFSTGLVFRIP
jgi:hypothetical protein